MATAVTRTPPPAHSIAAPRAPRYGARLDLQDSQSHRKATRFAAQRSVRTPSPGPSNSTSADPFSTPRRSSRHQTSGRSFSPPPSPTLSPQHSSHKRTKTNQNSGGHSSSLGPNMLPTPAKTPRKKEVRQAPTSTSRVLFPSRPANIDEAMPGRRNRNRGRGLGHNKRSLSDDGAEESVVIFTDNRDKMPELDESEGNPFYVKPGSKAAKEAQKQRTASPSAMSKKVQEALEHDEGMVYVFRGKKIYRKFIDDDDDIPDATGMPLVEDGPDTPRHFLRSSVKPRFLFPAKNDSTEADEEAITDIEEVAKDPATPVKPGFQMPASPPTTVRATRSTAKGDIPHETDKEGDKVEVKSPFTLKKASKRSSPFDGWQRTKGAATAAPRGKKRAGSASLEETEPDKRVRL